MTLTSLLGGQSFEADQPIYDRGEHVYHAPQWKGGGGGHKKGPNAALSALTLLAFLFFLNILQTCLREQLANQTPITIMMTTTTETTTSTGTQRYKNTKGDVGRPEGKDYIVIPQIPRAAPHQYESACDSNKKVEPMKMLALWLQPIVCTQGVLKGLFRNVMSLTCNSTSVAGATSDCPSDER